MGRGDDEVDDHIWVDGGLCQSSSRKISAALLMVDGA